MNYWGEGRHQNPEPKGSGNAYFHWAMGVLAVFIAVLSVGWLIN